MYLINSRNSAKEPDSTVPKLNDQNFRINQIKIQTDIRIADWQIFEKYLTQMTNNRLFIALMAQR